MAEPPRSRFARAAAEAALVRVAHNYGERPEFVVLGGLVPELLCSQSSFEHAGTIDIDVQVNLEILAGSVNAARLERALRNSRFEPDPEEGWRWITKEPDSRAVVRFELLADLDDQPHGVVFEFEECDCLSAANLRGTRFAARDVEVRTLTARIADTSLMADVNVSGLAGFLLAKIAAAYARRKPKDWYDIAFVLLHNDRGGPDAAARSVVDRFGNYLGGSSRTALADLRANFTGPADQGPRAYRDQILLDHPELDARSSAADAVVAVERFCELLGE